MACAVSLIPSINGVNGVNLATYSILSKWNFTTLANASPINNLFITLNGTLATTSSTSTVRSYLMRFVGMALAYCPYSFSFVRQYIVSQNAIFTAVGDNYLTPFVFTINSNYNPTNYHSPYSTGNANSFIIGWAGLVRRIASGSILEKYLAFSMFNPSFNSLGASSLTINLVG